MALTVAQIAEKLGCSWEGEGSRLITGVAPLDQARPDQVSFLANPKYERLLDQTRAGCVIIANRLAGKYAGTFLLADNPYYLFARVAQLFARPVLPASGVSDQAVVEEGAVIGANPRISAFAYVSRGARLGDNVTLYPFVFVGQDSSLGDDTLVYPNVTIREKVTIGRRVIIHSGTVIGSDGYGFATDGGIHHKIPQTGEVIIGDDVELGAGVTIDRGTLGPTRIGNGCKFDNQVHVAHNVSIGENSLLVAQVGISGSTTVGRGVTIAGQSGLAGHITIGDHVTIAAGSAVTKSIPDKRVVSGIFPARDHLKAKRIIASLPRLPDLLKRVRHLEKILSDQGILSDPDDRVSEGVDDDRA